MGKSGKGGSDVGHLDPDLITCCAILTRTFRSSTTSKGIGNVMNIINEDGEGTREEIRASFDIKLDNIVL